MTESHQDRKRAHPVDSEEEGNDRDESVLEGVFVRRKAKPRISQGWYGGMIYQNQWSGDIYKSISAYHLGRIRKSVLARELARQPIPPVEAYVLGLEDNDTAAYLDSVFDQDWLDGYQDDIAHKFSEESKCAVWHSSSGSDHLLAYQMGAPGTGVNPAMAHSTANGGIDRHRMARYYNVVEAEDKTRATIYNTEHDVERLMDMFLAAKPHPTGLVVFRGVGGGLGGVCAAAAVDWPGCGLRERFVAVSTTPPNQRKRQAMDENEEPPQSRHKQAKLDVTVFLDRVSDAEVAVMLYERAVLAQSEKYPEVVRIREEKEKLDAEARLLQLKGVKGSPCTIKELPYKYRYAVHRLKRMTERCVSQKRPGLYITVSEYTSPPSFMVTTSPTEDAIFAFRMRQDTAIKAEQFMYQRLLIGRIGAETGLRLMDYTSFARLVVQVANGFMEDDDEGPVQSFALAVFDD
ncbi:hypothetical protein DAPPUDRAFT_122708 [Daphnia pulex]|uniref:Uncharacterized protein n=1 Tax=Daphnia pulex TaxID=6669 RepID=E9I4Z5_DAPPU|nr:hypothetical protein DAPPUDRAFT_122708 [Daphnia pulex]|eukprot:EFX60935.1 hypothetical protein DAPPUDRAFT_122708 [Daphnia pulex]